MGDPLVIPPLTTDLTEGDNGDTRTSKAWYYYWRDLGRALNSQSGAIEFGSHNTRPNPGDVPIGSIYVEDAGAGYALYELQNDGWHYIGGTNWGRISPDDRPTYLGVKDGGYTFRGTDQARTFVWSGTAWVETTPAWYGTHAARPAASTMAAGCLYAETDGANLLYEVQVVSGSNAWVNVAPQTPWMSDIDGNGMRLLNAGNIGIGTASPQCAVDIDNGMFICRNTGTGSTAASGSGVEIWYSNGGPGGIDCWDFTAGVGYAFYVEGNPLVLNPGLEPVGIGIYTPAYPLDVVGDVNISAGSVYRINGVPIASGGITTQSLNLAGAGRVAGTIYTNSTGKAIYLAVTANLTTTSTALSILTDGAGATTTVATVNTNSVPIHMSIGAWVLAGNQYQVTLGSGSLFSWFEWT